MGIFAQLTAEHRRILMAMAEIDSLLIGSDCRYDLKGSSRDTCQKALSMLNRLIAMVRKHEEKEDRRVFAVLVREFPNYKPLIEEISGEHAEINRMLDDFQKAVSAGSHVPNHIIVEHISRLMQRMEIHLMREEREIFRPAMEKAPRLDWESLAEASR